MNKRHAAGAAIALLAFLPLTGCGGGGGGDETAVPKAAIVRVGDDVLTEDDLSNLLPEEDRVPPTPEEKAYLVGQWVEVEVLYQEALKRGINADPKVSARIKRLEKEFLADHLMYLELRDRIKVTEEEVESYYAEHEREYALEYRVSHILVDTYEEAEKVQELLKTNSFAWVANRYSIDPLARRGGDLGYLTKGNMIPELEKAVFSMKPGDISGIIKSDLGYHIVKLVGTREALVKVTLADVREKIVNDLIMEKRKKAYQEFMDALMKSSDIQYIDKSYLKPAAPVESPEDSTEGMEDESADDSAAAEADTTGM